MVLLDPILIEKNVLKAFRKLTKNVNHSIRQGKPVDQRSLFASMMSLGDRFELQGQHHLMNTKSANFAEALVSKKQYNLASIIYGILIKNNGGNPFLLEYFGQKALAAAKKTKDPIHIMARADDLNRLYRVTEYGSKKHFKVLVDEEKALKTIISDYDLAVDNYRTISREPLPIEHYEFMLCGIKMEIAKIKMNSNPIFAINELKDAQIMMRKYGYGTITRRIKSLLHDAYVKFYSLPDIYPR